MAVSPSTSPRGGFSLAALRLPVAAFGIFLLLVGLMAWLVLGSFDAGIFTIGTFPVGPRLFLAAGILLVGVVVALEPGAVWDVVTGRSGLYTGNTLVLAAAGLIMLGLLNVLGARYAPKWDLTANKQFTISDQSVRVAQGLPAPVKVTGFMDGRNASGRSDFEALLNDYVRHSGGKISYETKDPEANPGEAIAAGVRDLNTVIYQMGDKKQNSTGTQERDITTALIKLTRPEKKLYFTTGHGERRIDGFDRQDYGQLKQALERDNFKAEPLNLLSSRTVPDDAAAVVVAGPTNPFSADERDALRAYLDGGGKLFVLMDAQSRTELDDLFARWEVSFSKNLIVDPARGLFGDALLVVADAYGQHATTRDLRVATFYPGVQAINYVAENQAVAPIARSSDRSWVETDLASISSGRPAKDDAEKSGPAAMAVAIEQDVPTGSAPAEGGGGKKTRVYLIGTANFISNQFADLELQTGTANVDLFLNAANWLSEQDDLTGIRPRTADNRTLLVQGSQMNLIVWSSALFLPLAVLSAGLAVWWTRR